MLNDKARDIYDYIKSRLDDGIPPTIREICTKLNIKSTSTAHRYIKMLVDEGLLEKMDNHNRAIRLVGNGSQKIPLIGTVTAGLPITAIENITDYVSWPQDNSGRELFALKVRGDSMIDAGIYSGDIVVVEKTSVASDGDIVVALVDSEEATVKRFFKEDGHFRLQPENENYEPIIVDDAEVLGQVVALIRYL